MKRLLQIVLVSSLSLLCFSCYYDELPEELDTITEIPDEQEVSFSNDIQPIFSANCTGCHDGNIASPDLTEGNAYNAIVPDYVLAGDADNSDLFNKSPGKDHQDVFFVLSNDEFALIKTWIDRGADNN